VPKYTWKGDFESAIFYRFLSNIWVTKIEKYDKNRDFLIHLGNKLGNKSYALFMPVMNKRK